MEVDRVVYTRVRRSFAVAELTETLEIGGTHYVTPEALVFDIDTDGLISKIDIFIKTSRLVLD